MREERLAVSVTFDERRGYIAGAPELRSPVVALSLGGLRRKVEALMVPDSVDVVLQLDGLAERELHRRRAKMGVTAGRARAGSRSCSYLSWRCLCRRSSTDHSTCHSRA
jgi:hypothetical protein